MKFFIVLCALVVAASADVSHLPSNKYLPPTHHHAASTPAVSYAAPAAQSYHVEAASSPAVSYSAPATQSYQVEAASAPAVSYSAPASESYHTEAASAPAASYSAPSASYETASYETSASEPAHSFSPSEGYSYKTIRRRVYRLRKRRDVSHLSNEYLPPVAASAPVAQYDSAPSYSVAASAPAVSYASPSYETASYETAASEPAHSFSSADGYRYKTARRRVYRQRKRRDVSHLSNEYLPPVAASAPVAQYDSAPSYSVAASAPAVSYASPSYETASYETAASEPAHSFSSADGYRYKTARRRVYRQRRRRDVSHLSNEYLPPVAASAPVAQYDSAPSYSVAASAPAVSYAAPSYETASYETAASEPAHSFSSADGYRYKTARRRVYRQRKRRDVSHLSNEYLPPVAASAPVAQYDSAPSYSVAASAPAVSYASPSYETASYETAASEPAHSFSSADGYRYKTARRRVYRQRKRRDVSHLSSEYLPPHQGAASAPSAEYLPPAASAPVAQYGSAPSYSVAASSPAVSYSAPASYETASYETAASEPAHSFSSADGYRYKTARRRVYRQRKRRDVSHLSTEYLPPHQGAASAPSAEYLPPVASAPSYSVAASAPGVSYSAPASYETSSYETAASEPAHSFSSAEGYRYKTNRRRVIRRRRF